MLCIVLLLSGCKSGQVLVREVVREVVHDTVVRYDSVSHEHIRTVLLRGDTVLVHDSVYVDRWRWRTETQRIEVRDSIPYPVEVERPVVVRTGYDRFCSCFFWIVVALVVVWIVYKVISIKRQIL